MAAAAVAHQRTGNSLNVNVHGTLAMAIIVIGGRGGEEVIRRKMIVNSKRSALHPLPGSLSQMCTCRCRVKVWRVLVALFQRQDFLLFVIKKRISTKVILNIAGGHGPSEVSENGIVLLMIQERPLP